MSNQKIRGLSREIAARDFLTNPTVAAELQETLLDHQEEIHKRFDEELRVVMRSPEVAALVRRMFLNCVESSFKAIVAREGWNERLDNLVAARIELDFESIVAAAARRALEEKLQTVLASMRLVK